MPSTAPTAISPARFAPTQALVRASVPPGAGRLVYQAAWSGAPRGELRDSGWASSTPWATEHGILFNLNTQGGPLFAWPDLPPDAQQVVDARNYIVEASIEPSPVGQGAYGVVLRDSARGPARPGDTSQRGRWRAGVVGANVFILGEAQMPGEPTPADLLVTRAALSVPAPLDILSPRTGAQAAITLRFEARAHQYTLTINNGPGLQVDDRRFDRGTGVGVWADRTQLRVRDFRVYSLAE